MSEANSKVIVQLDNRVRFVAAVLAVSQWPAMEQNEQPHAVHTQSKISRQFMSAFANDPVVETVNRTLTDGGSLSELFTAAVCCAWPSFAVQEPLPPRFADQKFSQQLAACAKTAAPAEKLWPEHTAVWQEAADELTEIFKDSPLPSFLARLTGETLHKDIVIVPTLTYPMLNSVICETAQQLFVVLPPPKAWGESPPWPFRDGVEWALSESCRELLHHLMGDVDSDQLELLKHAAATLFLEESLTEVESMSYLVRAKRQYQLPQLPLFVEQLRDCLADEKQTVYDLLAIPKPKKKDELDRKEVPMSYQFILTRTERRVGVVQLNRPKALNALSPELMDEVMTALEAFDADNQIGCMVVTGNERAFAAGADIKAMAEASMVQMMADKFIGQWDRLKKVSKPVIAAVSGYALGGGCELAMACDMIIASESARFGQPEIKLGVIPGAGGTQRLTKAVGKALAMEIVLNDRMLTAEEAEKFGLVNRVVPTEVYLDEAVNFAAQIAERAPVAVQVAKEAVNASFEMPLAASIAYERRLFNMLFATDDQKEGMAAFVEKRKPDWKGQ